MSTPQSIPDAFVAFANKLADASGEAIRYVTAAAAAALQLSLLLTTPAAAAAVAAADPTSARLLQCNAR